MKKLLEISKTSQCIHRRAEFTSYHPLTKERDGHAHIAGYSCGHPKCNAEFLKKHNIDFQPCNNVSGFPRRCPLVDALMLKNI